MVEDITYNSIGGTNAHSQVPVELPRVCHRVPHKACATLPHPDPVEDANQSIAHEAPLLEHRPTYMCAENCLHEDEQGQLVELKLILLHISDNKGSYWSKFPLFELY